MVYVVIPDDISNFNIYRIKDQVIVPGKDNTSGVEEILLTEDTEIKKSDLVKKTVLAFYTSCTSKPHRFQFIYIPEGYYKEDENGKRIPSVSTDKDQIINVKDCQYYCEINTPKAKGVYVQHDTFKQFYLPKDFGIVTFGEDYTSNNHDTTISVWYRGKRYGFAPNTVYISLLDRYCNEYIYEDTEYYGYIDNKYDSPAIIENFITNEDFQGTSGWYGTFDVATSTDKKKAEIESAYGDFTSASTNQPATFESVVKKLENGSFDPKVQYPTFLKFKMYEGSIILNSGMYDKRYKLEGGFSAGDEWQFSALILDKNGKDVTDQFTFALHEVRYDRNNLGYELVIPDPTNPLIPSIASIDASTKTATFNQSYTEAEL